MSEHIVDLLQTEWKELADLGESLSAQDWEKATDLEGWSVKDNFSHVIGTERMLLGESPPEGFDDAAEAPHVKNAIGATNERWVAARRSRSAREILDELAEVTSRRTKALTAMTDANFDAVGASPIGQVPYREFMAIRLMDTWSHEQDVRRAVAKPGHLTGPVAEKSLGRVIGALPFIVGKKAAAPEASVIVFDLTGPIERKIAVVVEQGRAKEMTDLDPTELQAATATLELGSETLCCLGFGRWDPATTLADGKVGISGDLDLGKRVLSSLPFMI